MTSQLDVIERSQQVTARRVWVGLVRDAAQVPAMVLIVVFRAWQLLVSPTYGDVCRFYPSCSAYGVEAVRSHGALRGGWLAVRRITRCHPWNPGGVDPVPPTGGRPAVPHVRDAGRRSRRGSVAAATGRLSTRT